MSFTLTGIGLLAVIAVVMITGALVWVALGRPWELTGLSLVDRYRIGTAVNRYDTWLTLRGVGGRRRRDLRDELRTNLWDAAQQGGARQALANVGPIRALAREAAPARSGPRWALGLFAALVAFEIALAAQFMLATVWFDAAEASGAARVEGGVGLVPGMSVLYASDAAPDGARFSMESGPAATMVGLLVFLIVARPWRLVTTASRRSQPAV